MKILAFPRDTNPYQELLYAPMRAAGTTVAYLDGPTHSQTLNVLLIPIMLLLRRLQGYRVLHIHWTYQFMLPWAKKLGRLPMQVLASLCWSTAHFLGYRIVWTAHNVVPHERQFWNDIHASRRLGNAADAIITHTNGAREQLAAIGVRTNAVHTIPHGSYVGVYADTVSQAAARKRLQLPAEGTVLLFFGMIRRYKGVEQLLEAITSLSSAERKRVTLLVAGKPGDQQMVHELQRARRAHPDLIKLLLRYIPDSEVQFYFRAADFTVLPYQESTTSGVALLALSFGCPIITPHQAAFLDLPPTAQLAYTPGTLAGSLRRAEKTSLTMRSRMSKAAMAYAAELSWDVIAKRTLAVFEKKA
jgi:glycosyltransferase involved in cell wall biosynthesis